MGRVLRLGLIACGIAVGIVVVMAAAVSLFSGGPDYEVVRTQEDAVREDGVTYDGIEVEARAGVVDEEAVGAVVSDMAESGDYEGEAVVAVRNDDGTSSRVALADFDDGSYEMVR